MLLLNIVIFVAIIVLIAWFTFVLLRWVNNIFDWLSSRLARTKKENMPAEISGFRKGVITRLYALLATCISLLTLAYCLDGTILNADFVSGELRKLDMSAVTSELLSQHFSDPLSSKLVALSANRLPSATTELSQEQIYGTESVKASLSELWPDLSGQVDSAIHSVYDYFLGDEPDLDVAIPLENLQAALKDNLQKAILNSPTPDLQGASGDKIAEYVDAVYSKQFGHLHSELTLTSATSVNTKYFSLKMSEIRRFTVFLPMVSGVLLVVVFLLIAAVILVNRNFKTSFWNLGITLLVSGLVGYLYSLLAKEIGGRVSNLKGVPSVNLWVIHVLSDVLANINEPVRILLWIGGGMVAVSLIFMLISRRNNTVGVTGTR